MNKRGLFAHAILAFIAFAFCLARLSRADDQDPQFAALQAEAKTSFKEVVTPFVTNYCSRCHGRDKQKGGINFGPALKKPGETASNRRWKQAVAIVKSHEMPPTQRRSSRPMRSAKNFWRASQKLNFLARKIRGHL